MVEDVGKLMECLATCHVNKSAESSQSIEVVRSQDRRTIWHGKPDGPNAVLKVDMHCRCDGCAKRIRSSVRRYRGKQSNASRAFAQGTERHLIAGGCAR
jgi:hypothetical protein